MRIYFNNQIIELPNDYMTLGELLEYKQVKPEGIAVALNNKIVRKDKWNLTDLKYDDSVTVITAAFGG